MKQFLVISFLFTTVVKHASSLSYCYVYNCMSPPCLSVSEAIAQGQTTVCVQSDRGCYTQDTRGRNLAVVSSGCVGNETDKCISGSVKVLGYQVKTTCCSSNLCNTGTVNSVVKHASSLSYCYVYNCTSPQCLSVSEAITEGQTNVCVQSDKGCYTQDTRGRNLAVVSSGCVGNETDKCISGSVKVLGVQVETTCCSSNLCNTGTVNSGDMVVLPGKDYCYVYNCSSSSCLSVSEAIEQGQTTLCEQSDKGCFIYTMAYRYNFITSGCVEDIPEMKTCEAASTKSLGIKATMTCCHGNLCNNGSKVSGAVTGIPEKEYCYVYKCVPGSSPCISLSEAVRKGQTTKCEKLDEGCFAMRTNTSSIIAGCIGDRYGVTQCPKTSNSASQQVVCCKGNGCNNQLTSAGSPLFTYGTFLVASVVLRTFVWLNS